jgi:hypothetical protein
MPTDLQGKWKQSLPSLTGQSLAQALEFEGNRFSLTVFSTDGSIRAVCKGWFVVQEFGTYRVATFHDLKWDERVASPETVSHRWIFRVQDGVLTVARGFENPTSVSEPRLERYTRIGA